MTQPPPPDGDPYLPPNYGSGYAPAPPPPGYAGYGYFTPAGPYAEKPSTNIGWAIAAIFLFWPLAIPAFIFSFRVDSAWMSGDRAGAESASRNARMFGMIGVIVGAVLFVLAIIFVIVVLIAVGNADFTGTSTPVPFPT